MVSPHGTDSSRGWKEGRIHTSHFDEAGGRCRPGGSGKDLHCTSTEFEGDIVLGTNHVECPRHGALPRHSHRAV